MKCCLVWFRRDLRLTDNPALAQAVADAESVVPVYIHAPEEADPWRPGAASDWWLHHSLASLERDLRARGSRLLLRQGPTLKCLQMLLQETGAEAVYWNRLNEPALVERDQAVEQALREHGVVAHTSNASLLFEPSELLSSQNTPYRVFTAFWRAGAERLAELSPPRPAAKRLTPVPPTLSSLRLAELELLPRVAWDAGFRIWTPGEAGALARLERFEDERLASYGDDRNRPDREGSSRLSPHLHFGEIGPRQVVAAILQRAAGAADARSGAATYLKEIGWREFAHHLLHHYPHTTDRPLDGRFEHYPWTPDAAALQAWRAGRTGVPIVDAGMRELWSTGWMHNRVRMIAASFLTKNLRIHWLEGARWFWDTLLDADLANNTLGWQWTAGCGADAAPYFRVFNPVLQAERFDPHRGYLRRWLPEISALPDALIHRPWVADERVLAAAGVRLGVHYPRPLVDLSASRAAALSGYRALRELGPM